MSSSTLGHLLLGIWLIAAGAMPLTGVSFPSAGTILSALMIASGILIVVGTRAGGHRWWS